MSKATKIYESFTHAKTSIRYHIIFSTKYRKKCLTDIHESVTQAFRETETVSDFKILYMELDKDHIHLLMRWKPNLSISQVVRRLKKMTTKKLWETEGKHLKRYYQKEKHLWTSGYFCSTVGVVSEKNLKLYIENQG